MKSLIIYKSVHHGNTKKIAEAINEILEGEIKEPEKVDKTEIFDYDLIGYGSGIYYGKHHESILNLVEELSTVGGKKSFIFSTSGIRKIPIFNDFNKILKNKLSEKGFKILDCFSCRGQNTYGPFGIIGGIRKDRPNNEDIKNAKKFGKRIKRSF